MSKSKPLPAWFAVVPVLVLLGCSVVGYFLWEARLVRRLDELHKRVVSLYYFEASPAEYPVIREEFLDATSRALSRESLREEARQGRLYLFMTTLDPYALQREVEAYTAEQTTFGSKDCIHQVGQYLYQFWSVPGPDSVERRRIEALRQTGMRFDEREWHMAALLYIFSEGKKSLSASDWTRAEGLFERVVLRAPYFAPARYLRGRARLGQGLNEPALQDFLEAERLDPSRPEYNRWGAVVLKHLGRKREAVDHLRKALSKDSDYPEAHAALDRLGN